MLGSLATVEQHVELDALGKAAVAETAAALGVDAGNAKAYSLGCGIELMPDPERRLTLTGERDALGMPRLKLDMTISDDDFARYRQTIKELGRQLLAARSGMIRLDRKTRAEWLAVMDWGNHHLGTARMHDDPKQGVVDANVQGARHRQSVRGRQFGVSDLWLLQSDDESGGADACAWPTM